MFDQVWFKFIPAKFRNATLDDVYRVLYTSEMQRTLSVANMWNDPAQQTAFLAGNSFLPDYLGLAGSDSERLRRKANLLRVSSAAFFVGSFDDVTSDGGIGPWQSAVFSYYDSNYEILPLQRQPFYLDDAIGLKALNDTGRLLLRFATRYACSASRNSKQNPVFFFAVCRLQPERSTCRPVPGIRHSQWLYDELVFQQHRLPLLI